MKMSPFFQRGLYGQASLRHARGTVMPSVCLNRNRTCNLCERVRGIVPSCFACSMANFGVVRSVVIRILRFRVCFWCFRGNKTVARSKTPDNKSVPRSLCRKRKTKLLKKSIQQSFHINKNKHL